MNNELTISSWCRLGSMEGYLTAVHRLPTLSLAEETDLARLFRQDGDRSAAERLVVSHLRLVVSVARRFLGYGLPLADLVQEGTIGLMRAVKRFEPKRGVRLAAFAVYHIRCEIQEYVIKNWRLVRVATTKAQRKLFFGLRKHRRGLGWLKPTEVARIAETLDVRRSDVEEMQLRLLSGDVSIPVCADTDDNGATFEPASTVDPEQLVTAAQDETVRVEALEQALATLDERSEDIVRRRWLSAEKVTLETLGQEYGISKERVRQVERKAFEMLRGALTAVV